MKLALNLPLMVYYQALGEAYVLCRHLGLDTKWLMEFLSDTSGAPNVLKVRGPKIAAALVNGDVGPPASMSMPSARTCTMFAEGKARAPPAARGGRRWPSTMSDKGWLGQARRRMAARLGPRRRAHGENRAEVIRNGLACPSRSQRDQTRARL